jgi:VanZ family protein
MFAIGSLIHRFFSIRWSATVVLVLLLDLSTYMAFTESSGSMLFTHQDKLLHMLGFFVLTVIGHISLHLDFFPSFARRLAEDGQRPSNLLTVLNWALWLSYGFFIEAGQKLLSYRGASAWDFLADVSGIVLGTLFVHAFRIYPRSAPAT